MDEPIPDHWRVSVLGILRTGDSAQILLTRRARLEWGALFPNQTFGYEIYDAFAAALANPSLQGKQESGMDESGEVWAFIFHHDGQPVYGKINLCPDGKIIIIYSAHIPLKGNTL
jgi:hypothetical protein